MDNYWERKEKGSGNHGSRGVWRKRSYANRRTPLAGQREDFVPIWEKKFCETICLIPWHKLLEGQRFMHLYENVMIWNDTAAEEAFKNAKSRFWEEMNGLPCKTKLPDPDIYIDKVDWDSNVDPELLLELERALEMDSNVSGSEVEPFMLNNEPVICDQGWGDLNDVAVPPAPVVCGGWDTWDDDLNDNYGSKCDLKGSGYDNGYTGNNNGGGWGQERVNRYSTGKNQGPANSHWRSKEGDGYGMNRGFKNSSRGRRRQERPRWQDKNPSYGRW